MRNLLLVFLFLFTLSSIYSSDDPILLFSDMESAPKSGWSSNEPTKGAAISIWGRNLGDERSSNYVTVNGVDLTSNDDYALWGDNWPTPFYQRITFWLNDAMADGEGTISVTVDGVTSNTLPFTIREGRIFFVSNETNGDGSINSPFKNSELTSYGGLRFGLTAGDILYYRGKTYTEAQYGANSFIRINDPDDNLGLSEDNPIAFISYPGEKPKIIYGGNAFGVGYKAQIAHSVFSGFEMETEYSSIGVSDWNRVIGNDVIGLTKKSNSGTASITTGGNGNKIFGNAIHGGRSGWRLDHATYFSGCAEVEGNYLGWNYVYDNDFGRGPELSVNHQEDRCQPGTEILKSHFIFSNIVDCMPQRATVVNVYDLSYDEGEPEPGPIFIYNNIFLNCGTLDLEDTSDVGWAPSSISVPSRGHARFYHNLYYNSHYIGFQLYSGELTTHFRNNIVVMNSSGELDDPRPHQYVSNGNLGNPNTLITDNLFFDIGAEEVNLDDLDLINNTVGEDPLFIDPLGLDFNFNSISPAIDSGSNDLLLDSPLPSFAPITMDIFGNQRDSNYDIGPLEYLEAQSCSQDSDCNDGLYCNGIETCQNNVCQSGTAPSCSSHHSCVSSSCNEATDSCDYVTDDSLCDDGNVCTNNFCDQNNGCQLSNNDGISCDDGISCTPNDICQGGSCQAGTPDDSFCLLSFPTCSSATCNPGIGCENYLPLSCNLDLSEKLLNLTIINSSNNFDVDHGPEKLYDKDVSETPNYSAGNSNINSFFVDFDLGDLYSINRSRLFGDDTGTWISDSWSLSYKESLNDNWISLFTQSSASASQWYEVETDYVARYLKLEVFGGVSTQAREFEVYGTLFVENNQNSSVDTQAPSLVSNFNYSSLTQNSLVLSWDEASDNVGVVGYSLFRDSIFIDNVTSLTQTDSGLSPNTTYTYEIAAFDAAGNVGPLTSLDITTLEESQDPQEDPVEEDDGGSSSSGGGSGGGSSGGGSSSSSSSSFLSSSAYVPNSCEPNYNDGVWSTCLNGFQTRTITDVNGCKENIIENRACNLGNTELENRFLNAKQIVINQTRDRVYSVDLKGSYNEIVYMESKLEESFVLVDEETGQEYLGRLVDENEDKFYYSLERIDQSLFSTLKDEGLLETTIGEDVNNLTDSITQHQSFKTVLFVLGFLVFVTVILMFRFYVKKQHEKSNF